MCIRDSYFTDAIPKGKEYDYSLPAVQGVQFLSLIHILYPKVIIPQDMDILLSEQDVYYIFLHELQHYKHKDAALNYIKMCIRDSTDAVRCSE